MTGNHYKVVSDQHKMRIDKVLAKVNPTFSRSQIKTWIDQQLVTVNDEKVKANHKCHTGDSIHWTIPEEQPLTIEKENIPLTIMYEDSDLLVVNKPRGMVVHPSVGHSGGTLVNALLYYCNELSQVNGEERPGIVHRIDKDTSGLIVVAKNDYTHVELAEQLATKKMVRKYEALVHGVIEHENGLIDAPIGRDPKDRKRMAVASNGKPAVTHFHVLRKFKAFSHVACQLETGRTHQIRVHMKYIGYPVVGDPKYGPRKTLNINGQALHAKTIGFTHPVSNEWLEFDAELPAYFQELLEKVEKMY